MTIKSTKVYLCSNGIVCILIVVIARVIYMCHEMTLNTHTLYPCQFPGFDIVLYLYKM